MSVIALMLSANGVHAEAGKEKRLLLVAAPEVADPKDAELVTLADAVGRHVSLGLTAAISSATSKFAAFDSEEQAEHAQREVYGQLRRLAKYMNKSLAAEAAKIQKRLKGSSPSDYLFVNVLRVQDTVLVNLELRDDNLSVVVIKSVELTSAGIPDLLERVRIAASRIAENEGSAKAPEVSIAVSPGTDIEAFESVRLDASASTDPDLDLIGYLWKDANDRELSRTRTLSVTPTIPGTHLYSLEVSEVVTPKRQVARASVTLNVRPRLRADAGASQIISGLDKPVKLDASASLPAAAKAAWRQVMGPPVELCDERGDCQARCTSRTCTFTPKYHGEYGFEVTIEDAGRSVSARVSYLVVERPRAIAGPEIVYAAPSVDFKLERNASFDAIDPEPSMLWTVESDNKRSIVITNARSRAPTINACEPGDYRLRLTVRARRSFTDLKLSDVDVDYITVRVQRPAWTLFTSIDTIFADEIRDLWTIGLQAALFRSSAFDLGVRWAQALASIQLRGEMPLSERIEPGGGVSIAAALTRYVDLPFGGTDFTAYLGYRYRFSGKGIDSGLTASVRLFEHFSILPSGGLEVQLHPEVRFDLKAGVGLGYQP